MYSCENTKYIVVVVVTLSTTCSFKRSFLNCHFSTSEVDKVFKRRYNAGFTLAVLSYVVQSCPSFSSWSKTWEVKGNDS